ncbi:MAG: hypothetical protein K2W95_00835 [Candidatus Obscuribacterales bacterium]|nr:hypothetical protein [Candidatus Obscuribacterales bacterium]
MITQGNQTDESAYQKVLAAIEANPDTDRDSLEPLKQMHGALAKDLITEVGKLNAQERFQQFANDSLKQLRAEVERLADDDEELADDIIALALRDFNQKDEYKDAREKFQKMEFDKKTAKELAKKYHDKLAKETKRSGNLSGMTTQATGMDLAKQAAAGKAGSEADLNENQRGLFNAKMEEYNRAPDLFKRKYGLADEAAAKARFLEQVSKKFV